jgi:uncharacterized lipoprotein YddW (UPF0748 family)
MTGRRASVTVIVLALLVALAPAAGPEPAEAATGTGACASHLVPATGFTDTLTSGHRAAIDCAVWWGLVEGRSATSFAPVAEITRGQSAAMVARMLRNSGRAPSNVPSAGFADTVGHHFEADIDLLAHLDIIQGLTATQFAPDAPILRGQMASVVARTFAYGYGSPLDPGPVPFTDVRADSPHRDAIGRLVAATITTGTSATTFGPREPVLRAQMASFLTRSADVLLTRGKVQRPTARPGPNDAYHSRMRGAWVHLFDDTLKTRAGIDRVVRELAAADANVVIAQVVRRHDAYYRSDVLPRTPDPAVARDFDVLAELIAAARPRGIEVHAWFVVGPTYHGVYDGLPRPAGWMHTTRGLGQPDTSRRWVTRSNTGEWSSYLDPGVPGVQDHVAAVVGELARRYPQLAGIHLDYVRYESANYGYNPIALERFRSEKGRTGTPAPSDAVWMQWRRDQTRALVNRARGAIGASGNDIALSAAVISWGDGPVPPNRDGFRRSTPYLQTLQDWDGWVREGAVDAVMPMNYFRGHDAQQAAWFSRWIAYERALATSARSQVVPGPGGWLNQPSNVLSQVRAGMSVDGAMIYSFQQPTSDGTRGVWSGLATTRWGYAPVR